jgi:hypothetical protein
VRSGLELEQQVGARAGRSEQGGHNQDRGHKPLPYVVPEHLLAAEGADQQRTEQRQEDQWLDDAEDH